MFIEKQVDGIIDIDILLCQRCADQVDDTCKTPKGKLVFVSTKFQNAI